MYTELSNLASLHQALNGTRSQSGDLLNKVGYSLQLSIGRVLFRSNDFTKFEVEIAGIGYPAVLFFNPKFYVLNGYPKLGEYVIIMHNNGQNAHIIFSANPKDIHNPPLGGTQSKAVGIFSSAKCSL